jgi:hypothetical protein
MTPLEYAEKHLSYVYWETPELIIYRDSLPDGFMREAVTHALNRTHWGILRADYVAPGSQR